MAQAVTSPAADEVKPYKIHIPSKHLDLTRQKLELTRLPHEPSHAPDSTTWAPKPIIEPLIDYWLESYSWRTTESRFNTNPHLPQFRTAITPPGHQAPIRIHFIHARSHAPNAVPLLLIPPFPLPALSLAPLIPLLTGATTATTTASTEGGTQDEDQQQHFHLIIPSLPGTAFSDPLPPHLHSSPETNTNTTTTTNPITTTAAMLNTLMHRLNYPTYLTSATAPGVGPTTAGATTDTTTAGGGGTGRVGERIVRRLATAHAASCVGAHLIAPLLRAPPRGVRGWWGRWVVKRVLNRGGGGGRDGGTAGAGAGVGGGGGGAGGGGGLGRVVEPDTLAYALCDSPVGMLAFVLRGLRLAAGGGTAVFTREEVVTLVSLMWLPGPEGMLRFWAGCARHWEEEKIARGPKPRVAITVFAGTAGGSRKGKQPETVTATAVVDGEEGTGLWPTAEEVAARKESYYPPAWANTLFDVVHTQRVAGPSSGLLAWEQPDVILAGVRGLAKAVLAKDARLVPVVPSAGLTVGHAATGKQAAGALVGRPKPVAVMSLNVASSPAGAVETIPMADGAAAQDDDKGKGKDAGLLSPPAAGPSAEDGSPGMLVNTPPLERA